MKLKKILALGAAAALSLGLGACGGASDSEIAKNSDNKMQVFQFDELKNGQTEVNFPANTPVLIKYSDEMLDVIPDGYLSQQGSVEQYVVQNRILGAGNCVFERETKYVDSVKQDVIKTFDENFQSNYAKKVDKIPEDDNLETNQTYVTNDYGHVAIVYNCESNAGDKAFDDDYNNNLKGLAGKGMAGVGMHIEITDSYGLKILAGVGDGLTLSATGKWQFDPESVKH